MKEDRTFTRYSLPNSYKLSLYFSAYLTERGFYRIKIKWQYKNLLNFVAVIKNLYLHE